MNTVTLKEHETAKVGDSSDCAFSFQEMAALEKALPARVQALQWTSRSTVKTTEQVGMVATGSIRLEILPKVGNLGEGDTRAILMRMIAAALDIQLHDGEITGHHCQERDLLEVLIGLFALRMGVQLRAGLCRAYRRHTNDLSRLRGKLNVMRQFTSLATSPQKLACRYDELTANTGLNRLLLCALMFLRQRSLRSDTQRLLAELTTHFEDVYRVSPQEALNERFILNRAEQRWSVLEALARLLLSANYQTTHAGDCAGIALLFDMNLLFEKYVAALTRPACLSSGYTLQMQGPQRCLVKDQNGQSLFHTKPDMHLHRGEDVVVLDTKWKRLDQAQANLGITQADTYQMHGYEQTYKARTVALVYPHPPEMRNSGLQSDWQFAVSHAGFRVITIDLARPDEFAGTLGRLIEAGTGTT